MMTHTHKLVAREGGGCLCTVCGWEGEWSGDRIVLSRERVMCERALALLELAHRALLDVTAELAESEPLVAIRRQMATTAMDLRTEIGWME
jgi:hypothetical protein